MVFKPSDFSGNEVLLEWSGTDDAGMGCVNGQVASPVSLSRFNGDIAIMRLYPTLLNAAQIQANYLALQPAPMVEGTVILVF